MIKFDKRISVFGGRVISDDIYQEAVKLGKLLAEDNYLVFCGGAGGAMEAIAKGVAEGNGVCIGILKGETIDEANKYISIPVATGIGVGRNVMLAYNCDIAVAVSGSYGTLSEISYALSMGKKVIGLQSWEIDGMINVKDHKSVFKLLKENFS